MADILILDWMEEFESLTESEIHTYATEQENNHEVMLALYSLFEDAHKCKNTNLIEKVCNQLFGFYRKGETQLQHFTMQYIPALILLHLSDKTAYPAIETLLVGLYNLEVIDAKSQPRVVSFRVPSIAQSSIYHDSTTLEPAFIAENSLRRWEECNSKLVNWGPLPQVENLNAQNRQRVVTALVFLYNHQLANMSLQGLEHACKAISRITSQGFHSAGSSRTSIDSDSFHMNLPTRLIVSSQLLLEFLHAIYHALERGASGAAQALHDLTQRAIYETYGDVCLMAQAVHNLLHRSPTSSLPIPTVHVVSKSMITNASFRTKKLPDDIPIQADESEATLGSITEEQEENEKGRARSGSALKHLPKLPGLKKQKVKNSPPPAPRETTDSGDSVVGNLEMRLAAGDQVSLISGTFTETADTTVHVSAV